MKDEHIGHYIIPTVVVIAVLLIGVAVWSQSGTSADSFADDKPVEREIVGEGGLPTLGDKDAKVHIVVFSDFSCSFCQSFANTTLRRIQNEFGDSVTIHWRDFPFLGQEAWDSANAARCAAEQSAFWPYHDEIFSVESYTRETLVNSAEKIGLNTAQFTQCLTQRRYQQEISADAQSARDLGIQGAPTVFIGMPGDGAGTILGERIVGAQSYEVFKNAILRTLTEK